MPELRPFCGIRYSSSDDLAEKACPPYDIISEADVGRLLARHPHNAVRLEVASGRLDGRYDEVARTFEAWMTEGVLAADESPSLYVYRQDFEDGSGRRRSVTGVIGDLRLEPLGSGVLPHEQTMAGPKKDRLALLRACPVNFSPIYAIFHGRGGLAGFYESVAGRPSVARVADGAGVLHRLWTITAGAELDLLRDAVKKGPLVIADGHHRYETALAYREEQPEDAGSDGIMCLCVDADSEDLVVLPYHRVVRGVPADDLEGRLESLGAVGPAGSADGARFAFVTKAGRWLLRTEDRVAGGDPNRLDVAVLHEELLPSLFPDGITEIVFSKDRLEIDRLVSDGPFDLGVVVRPVDAKTVVDVASSGARMPQKASYFWPKAITGLVFRSLR